MLRNHGRGKSTDIELWGLNCRMDNVHAAILNFKLAKLSGTIERRRQIARLYTEGLSDMESLKLPPPPGGDPDYFDVYQNYEMEAERRDKLANYLSAHGVETLLPWGGKGVHQFPALGLDHFRLPRTDELFRNALMLPLYPELSTEQIEYVIKSVRRFYLG
jgi:dTDP-4-amino-4,6-dideoxygalactose transaminase